DPLDVEQVLVGADRTGQIDAVEIDADAGIKVEGKVVGADARDGGGKKGIGPGEGRAAVERDVGRYARELRDVGDGALVERGGVEGRNRHRNVLQPLRAALRGDDDVFLVIIGAGGLGRLALRSV